MYLIKAYITIISVWVILYLGLKKKLLSLSKEKDCKMVSEWIKSTTNHLYGVAASSPRGNTQLMLQKWTSMGNHLQNVHEEHGELYPVCSHENLEGCERKQHWFKASKNTCSIHCQVELEKY
jgi:hypothetical protein